MLKKLIFAGFALASLSAPAVAEECPVSWETEDRMEKIVDEIKTKNDCSEAAAIAEKCAYGSSADVYIAGAARMICLLTASELDDAGIKAMKTMDKRCMEKYSQMDGTMYQSAAAFCSLSVAKAVATAYTPVSMGEN